LAIPDFSVHEGLRLPREHIAYPGKIKLIQGIKAIARLSGKVIRKSYPEKNQIPGSYWFRQGEL